MHKSNISKEEEKQYWIDYIRAVAFPFKSNSLLNSFITNPNVTGAYGEAWVKSFAASMLPQYRVSTGAVIGPRDRTGDLRLIPQCDIIIWDPSAFPALFERGDFAIVPYMSARAIIEVKRSCKSAKKFSKLNEQLDRQQRCLDEGYRHYILGVIVSDSRQFFQEGEVTDEWLKLEKFQSQPAITRLLDKNNDVNERDFMAFIYFLTQIADDILNDE